MLGVVLPIRMGIRPLNPFSSSDDDDDGGGVLVLVFDGER